VLLHNNSTVLHYTPHTIEYLQQKMLGTMFLAFCFIKNAWIMF